MGVAIAFLSVLLGLKEGFLFEALITELQTGCSLDSPLAWTCDFFIFEPRVEFGSGVCVCGFPAGLCSHVSTAWRISLAVTHI